MSCLAGASATWTAGVMFQSNDNSPALINSEAVLDTYPEQLIIGAGFSCADARQYLLDNMAVLASTIAKDGTTINVDRGMFVLTGASLVALINVSLDGVFIGQMHVGPGAAFSSDVGTSFNFTNELTFTPSSSTVIMTIPVSQVLNSFTFNNWWCCAAASSGCTEGCSIPIASTAPHFLIPPPASPTPVEERSSVPILRTPLYLANHTWSFRNNFGVIK